MKQSLLLSKITLMATLFLGQVTTPSDTLSHVANWTWDNKKTLSLVASGLATVWYSRPAEAHLWNWDIISEKQLTRPFFPMDKNEPFLFGVGTAALQVESGFSSDFSAWCHMIEEQQAAGKTEKILPGIACNQQNRYKEDVQLLKNIGANAYRFSTSWSKIQPNGPDSWDEDALQYYADLCKELVNNGIRPVITLSHYDDPKWFIYEKGGFEFEKNIDYFVNYCTKVYEKLKYSGVHLWFSFNAPAAYAYNAYMAGERPPAKKGFANIPLVRKVTHNQLKAHVGVHKAFHTIYKREMRSNTVQPQGFIPPRVGILKNLYHVAPLGYKNYWNVTTPLDRGFASLANWLQDDVFYTFFDQEENKGTLDFIGLNYYCDGFTWGGKPKPQPHPDETLTNNPRNTIHAEGLYNAIKTLSKKIAKPHNIPIYVTENGVAANDDDQMRDTFLKRYLYALSRAIEDGFDVRGYLCWSLMDNYEWGTYTKNYGLYKVDRDTIDPKTGQPTLERTLRPGSEHFVRVAKSYKKAYTAQKTEKQASY